MYGLDWIDRLRNRSGRLPGHGQRHQVSPVVWALGVTSFFTDISSEMVSSLLPLYLVLHLHVNPLQFGAIDGIYNGFATLLVALLAGWYADRVNRRKVVAAAGYGLSAACKLLLVAAGGAWGWIMLVVGLDRLGKGLRSAPRDALISLHTAPAFLASAFGVHRAMDAGGALLGPLVAFVLIALYPTGFGLVWLISFVFAALGVAAIAILVPGGERAISTPAAAAPEAPKARQWVRGRFLALLSCATLLSATTISDNFVYLLLQKRSATSGSFLPLYPVVVAGAYMLLAVPLARVADGWGRVRVFAGGYCVLLVLYGLVATWPVSSAAMLPVYLVMLGIYYAATEGVLVAMASSHVPVAHRTTGIALLMTATGVGKMVSSILFGWIWSSWNEQLAVYTFTGSMLACGVAIVLASRMWRD